MRKHVLLVDSDPESRALATETLTAHNYQVSTAHDGETGFLRAMELCPDCIVFDVDLQQGSGTLMYSRLRRDRRTNSIPAVVYSEIAARLGTGIPVVKKSGHPDELAHTLHSVLEATAPAR